MKVYDFDGTIYKDDSTKKFYFFCLRRNLVVLKALPTQISAIIKYLLGRLSKEEAKEKVYTFLRYLDNPDDLAIQFWDKEKNRIAKWYLQSKEESDVIISASPEFLLKPIVEILGCFLIASKVDADNGKLLSKNCFGEEKVIRFKMIYGNKQIEEFYTDSESDLPLAMLAQKAYLVKKEKVTLWDVHR